MIVTLRRAGGFAGLEVLLGTVDTATLGREARGALESQIHGLARLSGETPSPGADQFRYEVEVQEAGSPTRTFTVTDEGDPESPSSRALAAIMEALGLPAI